MKQNYQLLMDKQIEEFVSAGKRPRLLLHACCAPCSSYVLEYLYSYMDITILFYNPNISPKSEFDYRLQELSRLIDQTDKEITVIKPPYEPDLFLQMSKGLENLPEGDKRCYLCYELRLKEAAKTAAEKGFDLFTTTLSISPHKNADWINEIGKNLEAEYGVSYLYADFKKKNGYKRSIELSKQYNLYRQDYCGCIYSKAARQADSR